VKADLHIHSAVSDGSESIERIIAKHDEECGETIRDYANRHGLFLTGGSDYHGRYEPQPFGIGDFLSEESGVKAILRQ
jgi:predicted metal-dependent phosphoesterase TrpH